jgi:hypothetical protein
MSFKYITFLQRGCAAGAKGCISFYKEIASLAQVAHFYVNILRRALLFFVVYAVKTQPG